MRSAVTWRTIGAILRIRPLLDVHVIVVDFAVTAGSTVAVGLVEQDSLAALSDAFVMVFPAITKFWTPLRRFRNRR